MVHYEYLTTWEYLLWSVSMLVIFLASFSTEYISYLIAQQILHNTPLIIFSFHFRLVSVSFRHPNHFRVEPAAPRE